MPPPEFEALSRRWFESLIFKSKMWFSNLFEEKLKVGVTTHVTCLRPLAFLAGFEKNLLVVNHLLKWIDLYGENGKIAHFQVKNVISKSLCRSTKNGSNNTCNMSKTISFSCRIWNNFSFATIFWNKSAIEGESVKIAHFQVKIVIFKSFWKRPKNWSKNTCNRSKTTSFSCWISNKFCFSTFFWK